MTLDADSDHICRAIISLAKTLGLQTVAEGVETERQLEFLRDSGCDIAQGYLYSVTRSGARKLLTCSSTRKNNFAQIKPAVSFKSSETTNARILNMGAKYLT